MRETPSLIEYNQTSFLPAHWRFLPLVSFIKICSNSALASKFCSDSAHGRHGLPPQKQVSQNDIIPNESHPERNADCENGTTDYYSRYELPFARNNLSPSGTPCLVAPPRSIENKPGYYQGDWQSDQIKQSKIWHFNSYSRPTNDDHDAHDGLRDTSHCRHRVIRIANLDFVHFETANVISSPSPGFAQQAPFVASPGDTVHSLQLAHLTAVSSGDSIAPN